MFLEHLREMRRILKAQLVGGLGDGFAADEYVTGTLHDEITDGSRGSLTSQFVDEVAEVVWRKEQFLRTIFHRRDSQLALFAFVIIAHEEVLEAVQQIGIGRQRGGQLLGIKSCNMLQNQADIMHQNMLRMFVVPAVL